MDLAALTLRDAARWIEDEEVSPVELTRAHLERICQVDGQVNSYITVLEKDAMRQAEAAEKEIKAGVRRGALHGIPLALKDLFETGGVRTTHGSRVLGGYRPEADGYVVSRLKNAGAVILGKTNMHEIALGVTNVNPHFGPCRNPWDLNRMTGGSSGGSAAALSAGMCLGALGSDSGGSIRIPASLCGVVGLKPTFGRVSLRGVLPLSWNLDHVGPMARRVADVAILLQAIAGYDVQDPASINAPAEEFITEMEDGVQGWRIALAGDEHFTEADEEVWSAVQAAAEVFASLGAAVEAADFPEGYLAAQTNIRMLLSDAAAYHHERLANQPEDFGEDIRTRLQNGAAIAAPDYSLARREQSRLRRLYERFFEEYDVLLTPTTPVTAPLIEGPDALEEARRLTRFTAPFNVTGLPALSLPCGFTRDGLPIGLQIVCRPWAEGLALRAAFAYEQAADWRKRIPPL
ncbi:MAG: amidase [Chloroflexi bacterium]|nr:amidase [Chloroflexota bacterium]